MPSKSKVEQEIQQTEPKTTLTKQSTMMKYMYTKNAVLKKYVKTTWQRESWGIIGL